MGAGRAEGCQNAEWRSDDDETRQPRPHTWLIAETDPTAAFTVFITAPTMPLPPRGATREGNDQPMLDADVRALTDIVIENSTQSAERPGSSTRPTDKR
jgi:hypothetical protein